MYPVIGWLDFVRQANTYGIIEQGTLSAGDIDRAFIATNFEEVDLDANDDKSLCRYEFLELFVRLAKTKFYDKGLEMTIAGSLERLIRDYLLKNHGMSQLWQDHRDRRVWKLEVDDLMKANKDSIDRIFKLIESL